MALITNKSKNSNTFRFKSFADRVADIDIRRLALYHIGHENEQLPEEENETFFHQTLKKWMVLNLSDEFGQFSRKVIKIVTLPQLIHQKTFVLDLLLEKLSTATNLSLQPLLELLYVLARDLREGFYTDFQRVLDRLICLLNTQDAELLEWTLVCLAYLFKFLKSHLKKNMGVVFHAILPLLDEQRYDEHVTNFAVECFSFIARDVKDYGRFLNYILETVLMEQVEAVNGCGRLMFEMMRGTKGTFHSMAGDFLQFIFEYLIKEPGKNEAYQQKHLLQQIVEHALKNLMAFIEPKNMTIFWKTLCEVSKTVNKAKLYKYLLPVYQQVISYKDARYLCELELVVPSLLNISEQCTQAEDIENLHLLCQLICSILMSNCSLLTQLDTTRLLQKMLTLKHRDVFESFVLKICEHIQFELLVLPNVIRYFEQHFDFEAFALLSRLVKAKQPLMDNALNLQQWKSYPLHLKQKETLQKLQNKMENLNLLQKDNEKLQENIMLLMLMPHIVGLSKETLGCKLTQQLELCLKNLSDDSSKNIQILKLLICTCMALNIKLSKNVQKQCLELLQPYVQSNGQALQIWNLLLAQNVSSLKLSIDVHQELLPLLCSHSHQIRMLATHSLYHWHQKSEIYDIFHQVESIEPTLHNYRDQLLLLQRLDCTGEYFKTYQNDESKLASLYFLLGMIYQSFKYVWEPSMKLIEQYAKELKLLEFWPVYKMQLTKTREQIHEHFNEVVQENVLECWDNDLLNDLLPFEQKELPTLQQLLNYRLLLWQHLPGCGTVAEQKNAEIVQLFNQFLETEYRKYCENYENHLNLRKPQQEELLELEEEETATPKKLKNQKKLCNSFVKPILQTLCAKLPVFSSQPNPKALHKSAELYEFYMHLLSGSNTQLQKLALDCIMAYKSKALLACKENLYNLIDESKLKDELLSFKLDDLEAEKRTELWPILNRLLYGKMITKGAQKGLNPQTRKSLIMRFLAQCSQEEIQQFWQMSLGKYAEYCKQSLNIDDIPQLVQQQFDMQQVWSPKKLHSLINLLELLRKEFGGLMSSEFHACLLKLLIFVGAVSQHVLCKISANEMHPKMPVVFRNLRQLALQALYNFFAHLDNYEWNLKEIQTICQVYVWPYISKMPQESIHSPTVLLKLLLLWGEQPQYFEYLLLKPNHNDEMNDEKNIFFYIMELMLNEKAKPTVRRALMAMVERLLVAAQNLQDQPQLKDTALQLLRPFVADILKRLKMNFSQRRAKQQMDKRDLNILSLLTAHVEDAETCESLLQLLLPILIAKTQTQTSEELVCQVITTLSNLIARLENPESYLLKIAPLFEHVHEVAARKMLVNLLSDMAKKRHKQFKQQKISQTQAEEIKETARVILMLNAWDKRWVEQPDYDLRLQALKEVAEKLNNNNLQLELAVLIIYNCFYFIKYDKDMGLRDNAAEHLRLLLPKMTNKYLQENQQKLVDYLVGDIFMNIVKRLIKDSNENVRNESLKLLGTMVRECPVEAHNVLKDLKPLSDAQDLEVDFFENLTHLQSHRHGRALLKFCSLAENLRTAPQVTTLTQFILPLASRYLLEEKHAGKHTLIDAAIETLGIVCQLLPWTHYHSILKYYLMKMRTSQLHQKQAVRIVVRILDAFHFDLTNAQADAETLQKLKQQLLETEQQVAMQNEKLAETKKSEKTDDNNEDESEDDNEQQADNEEQQSLEQQLEEAADESDIETTNINSICILKQTLKLTPSASRRVMNTISTILIPTLNRCITEKSNYDTKHKLNRKRLSAEREEEEILRVPIALALVKLMQKLPKNVLDASLSGVFMKVCTFLRSPLKSVRMLTRDILKKIMLTLGSSYLSLLMDHLQNLLTRGFQVHVLSVTVHGVLDALRDHLQPQDIESCLNNLLEVALNDIFGDITAEKEIEKIAAHTPEAKPSAKSYLVLHIAARNIQENCLLDLLMPFKEHLMKSHSRKLTLKIQECFAKIVSGLVENVHISRESLLIFIYGTMSESITDLLPGTQKRVLSEQEKEKMRRARPDCFIIQPPPRFRSGAVNKTVKTNAQANAHILIEFGLEMLNIVLKRKKLIEVDYQPFLNPLLPLLRDSLKSTHIRVTTFALKCFSSIWNDEYELPMLQQYLKEIVDRMFEILKNLSTFGATKQEDNYQLVKSVFKALVALLRNCKDYELSNEQIDQMALHIEQDLQDESENPALSFSLLKALIARKIDTKPIHDIMKRVGDLCVISHSDFVRDESRNILVTYVMEYPLHNRVDQIIKFFSVQLCYSLPSGRLSTIQFLLSIIKKFPSQILSKRAEFLYLSLGTRLVNDEEPDCRRAVAECLEQLILRLDKVDRQRLFDMTLLFFKPQNKHSVREMAAALCSRFLNAEKQAFSSRLKLVFPTIVARLTLNNPNAPGRFIKAPSILGLEAADEINEPKRKKKKHFQHSNNTDEENLEDRQRAIDHEIIQIQYCLLKIFEHCCNELLNNEELSATVDELAYECQRLLAHDHLWVRCNAAKLLALIIGNYDFELVGYNMLNKEHKCSKLDFIYANPEADIKSLVLDLCAQMVPGDTNPVMIEEMSKIFLFVANMIKEAPFKALNLKQDEDIKAADNDEAEVTSKINLNWLMRNIRYLINKEVAKAPHCIAMRSALFTLLEGLITLLPVDILQKLSSAILAALVREMSEEDQNIDAELRQQALRVGSRLRKRIGSDIYDKLRTQTQMKLMMRRAERKKQIAQEKIHDPVRAAKRKEGIQERKKLSKKRKTEIILGKAEDVKQKLKKRKRKAELDLF